MWSYASDPRGGQDEPGALPHLRELPAGRGSEATIVPLRLDEDVPDAGTVNLTMVDLVEDLEALHRRMEEQAAKLDVQAAPESPVEQEDTIVQDGITSFLNSEIGKEAGAIAGRVLGETLIDIVSDLFPKREGKPGERPRSRFLSPSPRTPAVVAAPPPVAAAPAAAPVESSKPKPEIPGHGLDFVGFVNDRPKAEGSTRFPTEFLEGHEPRLDLHRTEPLSRPKMRGPLIDRNGREIIQSE